MGECSSDKYVFEGIVTEILRDVAVKQKLILTTIKLKNTEGRLQKHVYLTLIYLPLNLS